MGLTRTKGMTAGMVRRFVVMAVLALFAFGPVAEGLVCGPEIMGLELTGGPTSKLLPSMKVMRIRVRRRHRTPPALMGTVIIVVRLWVSGRLLRLSPFYNSFL